MARIPDYEIERLKKEISVERLAEARGIQLTRHGADLVGKCPFHDDRTPSLVITPAKNLWHCLGACHAGGTAIDWIMRAEGISFRHAVELLRADHLPLAPSPNQPVKHGTVRKLPPPIAREADDRALLLQVVDYYNESLKQSPEAMKYLESRGLKSSEMIDRFQLGFANRTLGYRLPAKNRAAVIRRDLGRVLLKLEEMQDEQIKQALAPKEEAFTLSDQQRAEAMELLRDPRLLERIVEDFARCGVVGEETNKLVGYLGAVSRHLEAPLAVIVQSSSAAGKSSLMEAVLAFLPEEQRVQYSAMTGQSLFYMGETDLKHKVLAIVEEEGAHSATYALKLLQSEGVLTIASTGKDPATGRILTHQYRVEGPVMIFLTTTAINLDEEMLNRCLVLTVNEDREQTQAIHRVQREAQTLEGLLQRRDRDAILAVHRNAQRLLKPVFVVNPYQVIASALQVPNLVDCAHTFFGNNFRFNRSNLPHIDASQNLPGAGRTMESMVPATGRATVLIDRGTFPMNANDPFLVDTYLHEAANATAIQRFTDQQTAAVFVHPSRQLRAELGPRGARPSNAQRNSFDRDIGNQFEGCLHGNGYK